MNGSLDMLRRKKVEARFFMLLRAVDATEDVYRDADLRAALALLAPRKRACVVLRYYCGCSLAEIADILGVSLGTVKSQLHKALRELGREMRLEPSVEHAYPPESLADQTRRPHGRG
jgi:RNA polymerase sigma factor (sigma-70 family)